MKSYTKFHDLPLAEPIHRAIADAGYTLPTPIQSAAIPALLEGRDLLGCAQTGSGKTAAFALPILHRLSAAGRPAIKRAPQALVLAPTRELAAQIGQSFREYGRYLPIRSTVIFGGVGQYAQVQALNKGVHVLVATPGRLQDLMQQRHVRLDKLEIFVLDEADRMLDMGFLPDIRRIVAALPSRRQSLFFSATMPESIAGLADSLLTDPLRVAVTPVSSPVGRIDQRVLHVSQEGKRDLLQRLLEGDELHRVLVFTRTKRRAESVSRQLRADKVRADAIHSDKSQNARSQALHGFRTGRTRVLVATDIAARGLDVDDVSHVINYDLPHEPESYIHRIGRTARAGASGTAFSFCSPLERKMLRDIERLLGDAIPAERAGEISGTAPALSTKQAPRKPTAATPHKRRRRQRKQTV
ncbi:MAG: DEAD/DEAH box helicase [Planctomycetes bacterium]|nr:DEAD/DEAH box helicase [Planctomycetota bacterium]